MGSPVRLAVVLLALVGLMLGVFFWLEAGDASVPEVPVSLAAPEAAGSLPSVERPTVTDDQRTLLELGRVAEVGGGVDAALEDGLVAWPQALLSGWVVDGAGRGVGDAEVMVLSGALMQVERLRQLAPDIPEMELWSARTTTDRDGRFEFRVDVPESSGRPQVGGALGAMLSEAPQLAARHPAFATAVQPCPPLTEGTVDVGRITVRSGAVVRGRVLDGGGRPVEHATITTTSPVDAGGNMLEGLLQSVLGRAGDRLNEQTTGADGRFEVTGLTPGTVTLAVMADEHPVFERPGLTVDAARPTDVGDLVLAEGSAVAGSVIDEHGAPLSGALIQLTGGPSLPTVSFEQAAGAQVLGALRRTTTTGDDGGFRIGGLQPGTYTVEVSRDGYQSDAAAGVEAGTSDVQVALSRLGELSVSLVDAEGRPLDVDEQSADVEAWTLDEGDRDDRAEVERSEAGFRVLGAGIEGTELRVEAQGFAVRIERAAGVAPGAQGSHTVALEPEVLLAGRVVDDQGLPVAGATVAANREADADGSGGILKLKTVVSSGAEPEGDRPADAVEVEAETDADGAFVLRGLAPGPWWLDASAPGFLDVSDQAAQVPSEPVEIVLSRGGTIEGVVRESDGRPVVDVDVLVTAPSTRSPLDLEGQLEQMMSVMLMGSSEGARRVKTDLTGAFVAEELPPGVWTVSLQRPGAMPLSEGLAIPGLPTPEKKEAPPGAARTVDVRAGETSSVELVRPMRSSLHGRVVLAGAPAVDVQVELIDRSTSFFGVDNPFGTRHTRTDAQGAFAWPDLDPGSYAVSTHVAGAPAPQRAEFELGPGEERVVDLAFTGVAVRGQVVAAGSLASVAGVPVDLVREDGPDEDGGGLGGLFGSNSSSGNVSISFNVSSDGPAKTTSLSPGGTGIVTDSDGRFELLFVEPGRYHLEVGGGPWLSESSDSFEVTATEDAPVQLLSITRGVELSGTLRSGVSGELLDDVSVRLSTDGGDSRRTKTEDGVFQFEGVGPGDHELTVPGSGFFAKSRVEHAVHVADGAGPVFVELVTRD